MNNWIKYRCVLLICSLVLVETALAQDNLFAERRVKNSISVSGVARQLGFGVDYARSFYLLKEKPLMINLGAGVGYRPFMVGFTVPAYIEFACGNKNRITISAGLTSMFNFDPDIKTEEQKQDYLHNTSSHHALTSESTLPYDNAINLGVLYRRTFRKGFFIYAGGYLLVFKEPDWYNPNRDWVYNIFRPAFDVGYGYSF